MLWQKPRMEILKFEAEDVIRTSGVTGGDEYNVQGSNQGNSTNTGGNEWIFD